MKPTDPSFPLPKTTFLQSLGKCIMEYLQWRQSMSSPLWILWLLCICIQGMERESHQPHNIHPCVMRSRIYSCALIMALPYSVELPWKTVCLDAHLGLEEHINVSEGWGGLSLFSIDDVVTVPLSIAVETQHLPMQTPPPARVRFVPIFTGHTLGIFGHSNTLFFLLPFIH